MNPLRQEIWLRFAAALFALGAAACTVNSGEPGTKQATQRLEATKPALGGGGLVPWPIAVNSANGDPIKDAGGALKSGWNGSLAELLAADAFAQCASTTADYHLYKQTSPAGAADPTPTQGIDAYLNHLDDLISSTLTAPCYDPHTVTSVERWLELRANPKCSADASKLELRALISLEPGEKVLDHVARDVAAYDTFNGNPLDWKPADNSWQLSGNASAIQSAHRAASRELSYADLNLCMAERLRQFVNSPAVFAAPPLDHKELLGVIRERAQLASTQYSMISTVFASFPRNDIPEQHVINDPNTFLVLFSAWSHWAAANSPSSLARLGEDYGRAIRLTISATFEFAELLARETSAAGGTQGAANGLGTWSVGSPRVRTMNLLYGGDPLGDPKGTTPRAGRGEGGTRADGKDPLHVATSLADPRFRLLFDLARKADVLNFRVASAGGIDQPPSSAQLYKSIEVWIRQQSCALTHSVGTSNGVLGTSSCSASDILAALPSTSDSKNIEQFELWKKYQLRPEHATTFVKAFSEAFGELFTRDTTLPNNLYVSLFHLLGKHGQVTIGGESWFHVDPNSRIVPLRGPELALAYARLHWLPYWAYTIFDSYPQDLGFVATTPLSLAVPADKQKWEQLRAMGAVQALAYARQSLLGGAMPQAPAAAAPFFNAAAAALPDLEAAVGSRTVTVQQNQYYTMTSTTCPYSGGALTCKRPLMFTQAPVVIEPVTDPPAQVVQAQQTRGIAEVARDPEFVPFLGKVFRQDVDTTKTCELPPPLGCSGPTCVPCNTDAVYENQMQGYGRGLVWRTYGVPWYAQRMLFLKSKVPASEGGDGSSSTYFPLYNNVMERASDEGLQIGIGGALNALGESVWAPLAENWAQPSVDAFGQKPNWAPSTDAALLGGAEGEESFSYLLRQAKSSAEAAAGSVQTAIAQITENTKAASAADSANLRAQGTADIELTSLCGSGASTAADPCAVPFETFNPANSVDVYCSTDVGSGKLEYLSFEAEPSLHEALPIGSSLQKTKGDACVNLVFSLLDGVAEVKVPTAGYQNEVVGSELGALLSEYRTELAGYKQAVKVGAMQADSLATDIVTAYNKVDVAFKTRADQKSYVYGQLGCADEKCPCATDPSTCKTSILPAQQQLSQLIIDERALDEQRDVADALQKGACARVGADPPPKCPEGVVPVSQFVSREDAEAYQAFGNSLSSLGTRCIDRPWYIENKWACDEAKASETDLDLTPEGARYASINKQRQNLNEVLHLQITDQIAALQVADKTFYLAGQARGATVRAARFGIATQIVQAQGHLARLADLDSRYRVLKVRAQQARARASLESSVDAATAKAKYGLTTAFRSYDLWRSQALLRDARTMALAARKAIEAHFLVDLSEIVQPQAFVDAPALWANDVYEPDLGAPTVIGLQPLESIPGAVYPNKLVDYVGNLERFVAGYPATHPTTKAQQDLEVITFPGPTSSGPAAGQPAASSATEPQGWLFFCPENERWLSAPVPEVLTPGYSTTASGRALATLCDGKPPTRARFTFSLDPWGLAHGYFANTPYQQRYNTRWRRLAVNLVGSGVRDCERATDKEGCGGSTFLRYSLTHSGPYWAVDFDRNWVDLQLPTGVIEGGKALAKETLLDPVSHAFQDPAVANAARGELGGRPVDGAYELTLELPSDVRLERIERLQLLTELDYWVRDGATSDPPPKGDAWSPKSDPSLVEWISPRAGVQLDANSAVSSVVDQSLNGNSASQTTPGMRPILANDSGTPSFNFDGVNQYLEVLDSPSLSWTSKGSYALWVKFAEPNNPRDEAVLTQWSPGNRFLIRKEMSGSAPMLSWYAGSAISNNYTRASTPIDDRWHFWTFEFDGSLAVADRMKIYRDGVRISPVIESKVDAPPTVWLPPPPALVDSSGPLDIGAHVPGEVPKFLMGAIGSIYVFRDVLDSARRAQFMSFEAPETTPTTASISVTQPPLPASAGATVQWSSAGDTAHPLQSLTAPEAVAVDRAGNLYVATTGSEAGSQGDILLNKWAANGTWLWSRTWGTLAEEHVYALQLDATDNIILAGDTGGSLFANNAGARDSFAMRVSPSGALKWGYQWGGPNDESARAIQIDSQGAMLFAGLAGGAGDNGSGYTAGDIEVLKLSSTGSTLWNKIWGSAGAEWATGASLDPQGNLFISGRTDGALLHANAGCSDAFAAKLNGADGSLMWQQQWGSTGGDWAKKGTIDVNGDFVTVGYTDDAACNALSGHAFIRKLSGSTGEEVWTRNFPAEATDAQTVATRPDGTILVGGRALGAFASTGAQAGGDAYLTKWSEDGCELWRQQWGTTGEEAASALTIRPDGTAIVAGFTTGQFPNASGPNGVFLTSIDASQGVPNVIHKSGDVWQWGTEANDNAKARYDRDGNVILWSYTLGAMCGPSHGGADVYVRKVTPQGRAIWSIQLGTPADDLPYRVETSPSGMIHLAGSTKGSWFAPAAGGDDNVYVALDRAGNLVQGKQWGTPENDRLYTLAIASDSEIYVGGQSRLGDADAVVYRLNAARDVVWTQKWGGVGTDSVLGLAIAPNGTLIASGILGFTSGAPGVPQALCSGGFVRKLQAVDGSTVWNRDWPLGPGLDRRQDVVINGGELYVSGGFAPGPDLTQGCYTSSPLVLKLDLASGANIWTTLLGDGSTGGNVYGLAPAPEGGVLAAMNGTPPPLEGVLRTANGSAAVTMVTPDGTKAWTRNWGSEGLEFAYTVDVFHNKAIVAGVTTGPLGGTINSGAQDGFLAFMDLTPPPEHFLLRANTIAAVNHAGITDSGGNRYTLGTVAAPPASDSNPVSTTNGADITLTKRDSAGTPLWTRQWGSTSDEGLAGGHSLALALNDSVALAGTTVGSLPNNTNQGLADAFVTRWGSDGTELWTRQLGTAASDLGAATAVDGQGNVYLAGSTEGTFPGNLSAGKADAFVAKFDPVGTLLWVHQYGSIGDEWVTSASFTPDGTLWVTGPTTSSWGAENVGCRDVFLAQIDPSTGLLRGVYQWGSMGDDQGEDVATDSAGNLLLASSWNGSDNCILGSDGQARLAKISPTSGAELWSREWGSPAQDIPTALALDASDNVWVTGFTSGSMDGYANLGESDIFLTQFWSDGTKVGHRQWGTNADDKAFDLTLLPGNKAEVLGFTRGTLGTANSDTGTLLRLTADLTPVQQLGVNQWGSAAKDTGAQAAEDANGNLYLTGLTSGSLDGVPSRGGWDMFLSKLDPNGTPVWTRQLGTPNDDYAHGVAVGPNGDIYCAGTTGRATAPPYGGDFWLTKWTPTGDLVWSRQWGSADDDGLARVLVTPDTGDIFVWGTTTGSIDGGVQQGQGSYDYVLERWAPDGTKLWSRQWGTSANEAPGSMLLASNGDLYLAGSTTGVFPSAISLGDQDGVLSRWEQDGTQVWTKQFGTPAFDVFDSISEDPKSHTLLLGWWTKGDWAGPSLGGQDVGVSRVTLDGDMLWSKQLGSPGDDYLHAAGAFASGDLYVYGHTLGALPGQSNLGGADAFVMKLAPDGRQIWTRQFGTPSSDFATKAFFLHANGEFVVTGTTEGTLGTSAFGDKDIFWMKMWGG